jgi:hypothetical protein
MLLRRSCRAEIKVKRYYLYINGSTTMASDASMRSKGKSNNNSWNMISDNARRSKTDAA